MTLPTIFALGSDRPLAERIAARAGTRLAEHEEREFGGGEHKCRSLEEVGDRDVYVVHSLQGEPGRSANDKLVRLLFFIGALKDAGARRVTAIVPYLAYGRKDRRSKPRDPVSTRYVAALFEAVGADSLVTLEVHNVSAFENAFRHCRPEHLPTARLFAGHLARELGRREVAVVSPDGGGCKRAELFRAELERILRRPVGRAIMDKHRSGGIVSGSLFGGEAVGRTMLVFDDMIDSGATTIRATVACRRGAADEVVAVAAHGLFRPGAPLFGPTGPDRIFVTDAIPLPRDLPPEAGPKLHVVGAGDLLGDAILRLHRGEGLSDLVPYD